jgi:RNA polymerase sigma-70 factor (ECF subfamily)
MLGSVADAEAVLQETFLRWQAVSASEVQSPRAFLVTIVNRFCLNHLQAARAKREEYVGQRHQNPYSRDRDAIRPKPLG